MQIDTTTDNHSQQVDQEDTQMEQQEEEKFKNAIQDLLILVKSAQN